MPPLRTAALGHRITKGATKCLNESTSLDSDSDDFWCFGQATETSGINGIGFAAVIVVRTQRSLALASGLHGFGLAVAYAAKYQRNVKQLTA